ncbi:hypothetical protein MGU_08879 [Metarhizium guizhouense ARSEF 977]|uniref:Uncharacterized protein n=2 Tax=Metarhizium TaxID=5529 RepID=A0A0B4GW36_METGA|nr:hypothetical protein MGU_08879 [Metarhizium guizhouense ARSEF 977]
MADSIKGSGLPKLIDELGKLADRPDLLHHTMARFVNRPPSYTSQQSHNSTRSQSPTGPSEAQRRDERRQWLLRREHTASLPNKQFSDQVHEETERIIKGIDNRTLTVPLDIEFDQLARQTVRKRWVEQGIWRDEWDDAAHVRWKWKHEAPPERSSEYEDDARSLGLFAHLSATARPKQARPKKDQEFRQRAERHAVWEHGCDASRPFNQFVYQISKERERIQGESATGKMAATASIDIYTKAYEDVKNIWVERGIWDARWGILPGMSWKHERPIEELFDDNSEISCGDRNLEPERAIQDLQPQVSAHTDHLQAHRHSKPEPRAFVGLSPRPSGSSTAPLFPITPDQRRRRTRNSAAMRRGGQRQPAASPGSRQNESRSEDPLKPMHRPKVAKAPRSGGGQKSIPRLSSNISSLSPEAADHAVGTVSDAITPRRSRRLQNNNGAFEINPTAPVNPPRAAHRRIGASNQKSRNQKSGVAKPQPRTRRRRA